MAAAVERAFVNGYGVGRTGAVKAETRVKDVALAVERNRGVTAGIVLAAD